MFVEYQSVDTLLCTQIPLSQRLFQCSIVVLCKLFYFFAASTKSAPLEFGFVILMLCSAHSLRTTYLHYVRCRLSCHFFQFRSNESLNLISLSCGGYCCQQPFKRNPCQHTYVETKRGTGMEWWYPGSIMASNRLPRKSIISAERPVVHTPQSTHMKYCV